MTADVALSCGCVVTVDHTSGDRLIRCHCPHAWVISAEPSQPRYFATPLKGRT